MNDAASESSIGGQAKEKRTRRRQRLSCVECTKRRQKCDRKYPCGLCVSRGVAHLCHWASGPVSRPTPARPPVVPDHATQTELSATIKTLSERLATLERTIGDQSSSVASGNSPPGRSSSVDSPNGLIDDTCNPEVSPTNNSENEEDASPASPLQRDVHEAAVTLAQLSLAHHGEYVGHGTILCALHKLGSPVNVCFPYPKSTESTSAIESQLSMALNPVQALAARGLPPRQVTDSLVLSFFDECNWRFGIPEKWFRVAYSRMWRALDAYGAYVGSGAEQINANWLFLLFSMLALAPPVADTVSRETCFLHALSARRLAEDALLTSSFSNAYSPAEGTVLGCLATALISSYLASRGRVSEAWKLVGSAIRAGQAAGMHRNPLWAKWHVMCEDERVLRCRGWWGIFICDQIYSNVLGRPAMINRDAADVPHPPLSESNASEESFSAYQRTLVKLCEIVSEAGLKCAGPRTPPYGTILEVDRCFEDWLNQIPKEFQWYSPQQTAPTTRAEIALSRQRYLLATWYLGCRMNLHRPWLTRATPPVLPLPAGLIGSQSMVLNPSREKCITLAMELVHMQCAMYGHVSSEGSDFARTFYMFDGAVTLINALAYAPDHPSARRCREAVERAVETLKVMGGAEGKGEIARRATEVLGVLNRAGGWTDRSNDEQERESTRTVDHGFEPCVSSSISAPKPTLAPGFTPQPNTHTTLHSRMDLRPQDQPSIPFFPSSNFSNLSTTSNILGSASTPAVAPLPLHPVTRDDKFIIPPNREGNWASPTGLAWNSGTREVDIHMMMPFEMLQGMPLDEAWGGT